MHAVVNIHALCFICDFVLGILPVSKVSSVFAKNKRLTAKFKIQHKVSLLK
jgi:arginine exporter protein ArgO